MTGRDLVGRSGGFGIEEDPTGTETEGEESRDT